jgi:hypothetical protein
MLFQLPPTLPPAIADTAVVEIMAECEKGSRDCFPEDRVGITVEATKTTVLDFRAEAISTTVHPEVNS